MEMEDFLAEVAKAYDKNHNIHRESTDAFDNSNGVVSSLSDRESWINTDVDDSWIDENNGFYSHNDKNKDFSEYFANESKLVDSFQAKYPKYEKPAVIPVFEDQIKEITDKGSNPFRFIPHFFARCGGEDRTKEGTNTSFRYWYGWNHYKKAEFNDTLFTDHIDRIINAVIKNGLMWNYFYAFDDEKYSWDELKAAIMFYFKNYKEEKIDWNMVDEVASKWEKAFDEVHLMAGLSSDDDRHIAFADMFLCADRGIYQRPLVEFLMNQRSSNNYLGEDDVQYLRPYDNVYFGQFTNEEYTQCRNLIEKVIKNNKTKFINNKDFRVFLINKVGILLGNTYFKSIDYDKKLLPGGRKVNDSDIKKYKLEFRRCPRIEDDETIIIQVKHSLRNTPAKMKALDEYVSSVAAYTGKEVKIGAGSKNGCGRKLDVDRFEYIMNKKECGENLDNVEKQYLRNRGLI